MVICFCTRKTKKQSLDSDQTFFGARLFHFDDASVFAVNFRPNDQWDIGNWSAEHWRSKPPKWKSPCTVSMHYSKVIRICWLFMDNPYIRMDYSQVIHTNLWTTHSLNRLIWFLFVCGRILESPQPPRTAGASQKQTQWKCARCTLSWSSGPDGLVRRRAW